MSPSDSQKPDRQTLTDLSHVNVRAFGAVGDGMQLDTTAIQEAIDSVADHGGGIVCFTPGIYLTGSLRLRSNLVLEVMPGATILGSPRIEDYPLTGAERTENTEDHGRYLFHGTSLNNVVFRGGGRIDGNGPYFWERRDNPRAWKPSLPDRVSPMIKIMRSTNLRFENLEIGNSPGWTINLFCCQFVWIDNLKIDNELFGANCDAMDLDGCRDVCIASCQITCGDDAICLKTTRYAQSCERITATNCIIQTNCAAFRIGAESWHDFRQITFSNSVVHRSSRGVDIAMIDGATVEDVVCSNLVLDTNCGITMNRAIHLELRENHGMFLGNVDAPVGNMRRILLSNITLVTDGRILLTAADGGMLEDVTLRDIAMSFPWIEEPEKVKDQSDAMQSSNFNPEARVAPAACVVENARNFQLYNLTIRWPDGKVPADFLSKFERGEVLFDPARREEPVPEFHAFWGKYIRKGVLDFPLAVASAEAVEIMALSDCDVTIR